MLACVVRACKSRREGGGRSARGERVAKAARRRQVFSNVQHVFVQISSNELVDFIKLFFFKKENKKSHNQYRKGSCLGKDWVDVRSIILLPLHLIHLAQS